MNMKNAIKNYASDIIPEIIMIILNFILLRFFYNKLGTNIYALYQLFSQFFAYLILAEAGFSSASLFSLYKPISQNDTEEINRKLSGIKFIFRIIGLIIILLGVIVTFFIPLFIKNNTFNNSYIYITFILYLISNSVNYFFYTYRILYDAQQKKYIPNIIYQTGSIIKYIAEILVLVLGYSFPILLIVCIICNLLTNLFMTFYAKKKNQFIKFTKNKDMSMLKGTKDIFVHKIGGVVANNIDIILVSTKLGLNYVAMYGAYNYIANEITKFTSKIGVSLYSIIGVNYSSNEKSCNNKFIQFNSFMFFIATIICSSLIFSYNSFISVFYGQELILNKNIVFCFIFLIYFQIIRVTLNTFVNGCGLFKETKLCTITEAIINFILSVITIKYLGIFGILLSTIISYIIADFIIKPAIVSKKIKLFTIKNYYKEILKNSLCIIILIFLNLYFYDFRVSNLFLWFMWSVVFFCINTVISLLYFYCIKRINWLKSVLETFKKR